MTTDDLLAILADRGLALVLRPDGVPALRGPAAAATDTLRAVLPFHRPELLRRLGAPAPPAAPPAPEPDHAGESEEHRQSKWGEFAPPAPEPAPAQEESPPAQAAPAAGDPAPRRAVLLDGHGGVAEVLGEIPARRVPGELCELASRHPGRTLAAQWLDRARSPPAWRTWMKILWPG